MSKGRIVVAEDDKEVAEMLQIYFSAQGYEIDIAVRGADAMAMATRLRPSLLLLDVNLPDIDGFSLYKALHADARTKHIPVIFLSGRDDRTDKLAGLALGADDYVTKPFDIVELRLRIANAIRASERQGLTDPRTGLPAGRLIEEALRDLLRHDAWAFLDMRINHFDPFKDRYGFLAGDEVLRFTSLLITNVVAEKGTGEDFIGHAGGDNFVLITSRLDRADEIRSMLQSRFRSEVKSHYAYTDRQQGGARLDDGSGVEKLYPLMTLAVGMVTSKRIFSDIREITEAAAEARRRAQLPTQPIDDAPPDPTADTAAWPPAEPQPTTPHDLSTRQTRPLTDPASRGHHPGEALSNA